MKIYTRTGDSGETGLFGGGRVSKAHARIEAYGTVDELNGFLGWAETLVGALGAGEPLRTIQSDLFVLGADLATPLDAPQPAQSKTVRTAASQVEQLEGWIDRWAVECAPLTHFVLPGGAPGAAALHVCRGVCRRAERLTVRLAESTPINAETIRYLNRLSDLLFVLARWVNARQGVEETRWLPRQ